MNLSSSITISYSLIMQVFSFSLNDNFPLQNLHICLRSIAQKEIRALMNFVCKTFTPHVLDRHQFQSFQFPHKLQKKKIFGYLQTFPSVKIRPKMFLNSLPAPISTIPTLIRSSSQFHSPFWMDLVLQHTSIVTQKSLSTYSDFW